MDGKQSIPGLNRHENDAVAAIGAFIIGMLVLLCTTVLGLHFLSGLPPIMVYGIIFAVIVFAVVCLAAFVQSDVSAKHAGPPQLKFTNPARPARARRSARSVKAAAPRLKPLV